MKALTPKQEKFCLKYHETSNATESYKHAYRCGNMKSATINNKAYALKKTPPIQARLKELQQEAAALHEITINDLIKELEEARIMASTAETVQASAMTGATMSKAKLLGYLIDKGEQKITVDLSSKSDEELRAIIAGAK